MRELKSLATLKKNLSHTWSLQPPVSLHPVWPPCSSNLATSVKACCTNGFLDFLDLYLFRANISDLYPPNFILLICSMQLLVKYCQCNGSAYHCFFTFWTSGTLQSLQLTSPIICIFRWDLWKMNAMPSPITLFSFRPQGRITQSQPLNFHLSW